MMSHDTNYGYKKIFRLKGRQTGQKRSLEAGADAFSRLKISAPILIPKLEIPKPGFGCTLLPWGRLVLSLWIGLTIPNWPNIAGIYMFFFNSRRMMDAVFNWA